MLNYYSAILGGVDVESVVVPTFEQTKSYNLSAARIPHELFEATVMRV